MKKGFTLLEVLVAIAILGVIMVLVQTTTKQVFDAKERIEGRDMVYQEARVVLRKLSDDLSVAFLARRASGAAVAAAAAEGEPTLSPMTPSAGAKLATFFSGEDHGERDMLKFTTLSHLRRYRNARESEQARVKYELLPSADDPQVALLTRTEIPWLDERTDVEGKGVSLIDNVVAFDVEYYDSRKEEWVKEWDTEKIDWRDRLPSAVRVTLALPDPDGAEEPLTFSTAVMLALSIAPIDF